MAVFQQLDRDNTDWLKRREVERAQTRTVRGIQFAIVECVASFLEPRDGLTWHAEQDRDHEDGDMPTGNFRLVSDKLTLSAHFGDNRLELRPVDPKGTPPISRYRLDCPSIGVNPARTAEAIARDITRRLLVDAYEYTIEVNRRVMAEHDEDAKHRALCASMATAMGKGTIKPNRNRAAWGYPDVDGGHMRLRIEADRVQYDGSLPADLALHVARLMRKYYDTKGVME